MPSQPPDPPSRPPYRGRFAPSPTGPLHFGSLLVAFGSWLLARRAGGEWLVRVEDVDPPREAVGAARAQLRTLDAFGLHPDGAVEYQSRRGALYAAALARLAEAGLAFECHCSRADLVASGGIHRRCVSGARRADPAMRLRVPDGTRIAFDDGAHGRIVQDVAREVGDFVLRRADGPWAYQLAVVVDDAAQGITDIVRGADLLDSTPRQLLLQQALGLPRPRYLHLPLVLGADGRKLSKSLHAMPVDDARPLPALRAAWRALGQDPCALPPRAALAPFLAAAVAAVDPARIPQAPVAIAALHNGPAMDGA
ncbi:MULTISPECIES: tRNA glutamyl-Q(34) synthetase GluQRS [unclassified Luteimonas]|uniref:tRNA glutamyl-Q(34) synthetase GluQRS n=1 Tax=unclassified Luteimonas TaxID=2629088 RepID=UPI001601B991|nr:tRNA glutamyl-Q(34) synthetase GluQRS [Luteimonas sp. MC1825]MBB1471573.1 tRNA glutamyl-Q(34) synthetase GluQRS [Luteimonas sp. MC1782]MBB6599688.1 tRNA glutamyl-Q(34) synthetase GluQRS [Luteimonas sp. MC1825]QOC87373.1 tRNA glutamyl-Q(34) synthetase GluQRS [Luteimonas sp. MC1825]